MSSADFQHLIYSVDGCVASITFNRPKRKNAINQKMYEELADALKLAENDDNVTMVTYTGKGDYYSSGNDLSFFMEADPSKMDEIHRDTRRRLDNLILGLIDCTKLLIAIVNGPAIGIAVTTLAMFDLVYAADNATFNTPFTSLGQCPEACSSYLFPKLMGTNKAMEMICFGRTLTAVEAKERNLVTEVFPRLSLHKEVQARINQFKEFSKVSFKEAKELVRASERDILHQVHKNEMDALFRCTTSPECMECIMKFFQKRKSSKL